MKPLTERQNEVAMLMCDGCSSKTIAVSLGISYQTVKNHIGAILEKTGAENRAKLAFLLGVEAGRKAAERHNIGSVYK